MRAHHTSLLALVTTATISLSAGTAAAQDVDILQQDVVVDLTESDSTTIQFDALVQATDSTASFLLYEPALPIASATVDGVPAPIEPHPQYPGQVLILTYPTPLTAGQQALISVLLSGQDSCGHASAFCQRDDSETIFTAPSPGSAWYAVNLYEQTDPFVGSVEVLAPTGQIVVAGQGTPTVVEPAGEGFDSWLFEIDHPTDLLGLYAGVADTMSSTSGYPVTALYQGTSHDADEVQRAVDTTSTLIPVFEEQYGTLPIDEANIIAVPDNFAFGGMGMLGKVFVNEVVFTSHDYLVEQGMAHEFAHSWWGNLATSDRPNQRAFFSEGMAEYAAWRAMGVAYGDEVRTAGMRMNATWYMYRRPNDEDAAVLDNDIQESPVYFFVTYHKGAMVMRALEEQVGAEDFDTALKSFVARGHGGLSTGALIEDVLAASGYDASLFVEQWLRREGFPRLNVTPVVQDGDVTLYIDVQGDHQLHVPLRFTMADGTTVLESIQIGPGPSEHSFGLAERPMSVEVDPAWTMAREVSSATPADVNLDGSVDGADLIDVALRHGAWLPTERRIDGSYDALYDVLRDESIDDADLDAVAAAAM